MLISLNWLKQYVDIDIPTNELVELIGSRLVEVEEIIDERHKYDNVVVAKVVSAEKIPDTHLTRCLIDDGGACESSKIKRDENGLIQVMCGAPNVQTDMLAVWIMPGAIVPQTFHDPAPFEIGVRKMLKEYDSYGMLAGADELGIGDDHSGIVELEPGSAKPGDDCAKLCDLDDVILDIENKSLTHRPDTFGIIGFAREVAGVLGKQFKTPDLLFERDENIGEQKSTKEIEIKIEDSEICPRYTAFVFEKRGDFKKKYLSLQDTLLARSGMRPIEELVDATNYLMLLTGQPLHAFDYDKMLAVGKSEKAKIIVRVAKKGEKITLINDQTIELTADDILITSNDIPVGLAGAMGGKNTEIDENTKRVILESATFSLYHLRKTQMAHGIFSEAITRFTKGQPAGQTRAVAETFAEMVAPVYRLVQVADNYSEKTHTDTVAFNRQKVNAILGTEYSAKEIKQTLENVEFRVEAQGDDFKIKVPFWRSDMAIQEDVAEEVGRLLGYDNITPTLPTHATPEENRLFKIKQSIREILSSFGANEILTYSFVHGDLLQKVGEDRANSFKIVNSISPDLQYIRQSLVPSLLVKAQENLRANYDNFVLFEMNQIFTKSLGFDEDGVPNYEDKLAMVAMNSKSDSQFYFLKNYLLKLSERLGVGIELKSFQVEKDKTDAFCEPKRSADICVNGAKIGVLGEVKPSVARDLKLPVGTAVAELDINVLLKNQGSLKKDFDFSQYPKVNRDLTLSVATDAVFGDYQDKIEDVLEKTELFYKITPTSIFVPEDKKRKNLSFHIELQSKSKTLTNTEVQDIMKELEAIK